MIGGEKQPWGESCELEQVILRALSNENWLTDNELAIRLKSQGIASHVCINLCLQLAAKGIIKRESMKGKPLVNRIVKGEIDDPEQIILRLLNDEGDLTDKELAERLKSEGIPSYTCLNLCFQLNRKGLINRVSVQGKPLVNRIIKGEYNGI